MEKKSDFWVIDGWVLVSQKVVFDDPVTEEEAKASWYDDNYQDIIDSDEVSKGTIESAVPVGEEVDGE